MRIIFAGTPEFSTHALQALLSSEHQVVAVYTQPDRPVGRGQSVRPSPVKTMALNNDIVVEQPENFKQTATLEVLQAYQADVMVVVAYGLILPSAVIHAPKYGCLNIHASLLPRWRGAAPIQRAIEAGDKESGVCIMQMDEGLDTGDVLLRRVVAISSDDTGQSLHDALAKIGGEAIVDALDDLPHLQDQAQAQDSGLATYAHKLDKQQGLIDWANSAEAISRQLRAFTPWPGCFMQCQNSAGEPLTIRVHEVQALPSNDDPQRAGHLVGSSADGIDVACGEGVLRIMRLQAPGKKAMHVADFVNGHDILNLCANLNGATK